MADPRLDERDVEDEYVDDATADDGRAPRGCGLLGCALLILLLAGVAAAGMAVAGALEPIYDRFLRQPDEVVQEYLDAHERNDTERARRFLCTGMREGRLPDPAEPLGGGRPGFGREIDPFPYPRPGGRVAIYYRLDQHGRQAQAILEREDEGWRICSFEPG